MWSLHEEKLIESGNAVAIIGGGIGGITAALAAQHLGYTVTVFESADGVLDLQKNASQRYLHPRIFDWPEPDSTDENADLPILLWKAGNADDVIKQLRPQWELKKALIPCNVSAIIEDLTKNREVAWHKKGSDEIRKPQFDCIIIAVGFGQEHFDNGCPSIPYWNPDSLAEKDDARIAVMSARNKDYRIRHLISGSGDGGLIDVLRARIYSFKLEKIVEYIERKVRKEELDAFKEKLLEIDKKAWQLRLKHLDDVEVSRHLAREYESICKSLPSAIKDLFTKSDTDFQLRTDTEVTFSYRETRGSSDDNDGSTVRHYPYKLDTSILNRFLVALLIHTPDPYLKLVKLPGKEERSDSAAPSASSAPGPSTEKSPTTTAAKLAETEYPSVEPFTVNIAVGRATHSFPKYSVRFDATTGAEEFDYVTIRHGAAKNGPGSPFFKDPLKKIRNAFEGKSRELSRLDQTRRPIWPENTAFGPEQRSKHSSPNPKGVAVDPPISNSTRPTTPSPNQQS